MARKERNVTLGMKITIIGVSGKINSGKDTFADYLIKNFGFIKYSMATPLKKALSELYLVDESLFHDRSKKETIIPFWNKSPRMMMTELGMFMRENSKNHFINCFHKFIENLDPWEDVKIVIPDIRFEDEIINIVKFYNGKLVYISTKSSYNNNFNNSEEFIESDELKKYIDYEIVNDYTDRYFDSINSVMCL